MSIELDNTNQQLCKLSLESCLPYPIHTWYCVAKHGSGVLALSTFHFARKLLSERGMLILKSRSWMYLVEKTVEKSIYDISANRRLALMGRAIVRKSTKDEDNVENRIEAANTLELEQTHLADLLTKDSTGGEMVAKEDLWDCLFRQKSGPKRRVSEEAEREVAQHLGATAAESRRDTNETTTEATSSC